MERGEWRKRDVSSLLHLILTFMRTQYLSVASIAKAAETAGQVYRRAGVHIALETMGAVSTQHL